MRTPLTIDHSVPFQTLRVDLHLSVTVRKAVAPEMTEDRSADTLDSFFDSNRALPGVSVVPVHIPTKGISEDFAYHQRLGRQPAVNPQLLWVDCRPTAA